MPKGKQNFRFKDLYVTRVSLKADWSSRNSCRCLPSRGCFLRKTTYAVSGLFLEFPLIKSFRSSWSLNLSFAGHLQCYPAPRDQSWNINKFAFVCGKLYYFVFCQNQLWCYGNLTEKTIKERFELAFCPLFFFFDGLAKDQSFCGFVFYALSSQFMQFFSPPETIGCAAVIAAVFMHK